VTPAAELGLLQGDAAAALGRRRRRRCKDSVEKDLARCWLLRWNVSVDVLWRDDISVSSLEESRPALSRDCGRRLRQRRAAGRRSARRGEVARLFSSSVSVRTWTTYVRGVDNEDRLLDDAERGAPSTTYVDVYWASAERSREPSDDVTGGSRDLRDVAAAAAAVCGSESTDLARCCSLTQVRR